MEEDFGNVQQLDQTLNNESNLGGPPVLRSIFVDNGPSTPDG